MTKPQYIEYLAREIQALDVQIHAYLRAAPQLLVFAVAIIGSIVLVHSTQDQSTSDKINTSKTLYDFALLLAPLFMGLIGMYNANVSIEVMGMARLRDKLSAEANAALEHEVFVSRVLTRTKPYGTWAAYGLATLVLLLTIIISTYNAAFSQLGTWFLLLQIGIDLATLVAFWVAALEYSAVRRQRIAELQQPSK